MHLQRKMLAPRKSKNLTVRCMAPDVVEACLDLLDLKKKDTVLDLGCGDGRCLIAAAKRVGCKGIGYEIEAERADEAKKLVKDAGVKKLVTIHEANALEAPLDGVDAVILYLSTRGMKLVLPMIQAAKQPLRVASFWFPFPGMKADKITKLEHTTGSEVIKSPLYLYHFSGSSTQPPEEDELEEDEGVDRKKWLAIAGGVGVLLLGALGQWSGGPKTKGKGGKGSSKKSPRSSLRKGGGGGSRGTGPGGSKIKGSKGKGRR